MYIITKYNNKKNYNLLKNYIHQLFPDYGFSIPDRTGLSVRTANNSKESKSDKNESIMENRTFYLSQHNKFKFKSNKKK